MITYSLWVEYLLKLSTVTSNSILIEDIITYNELITTLKSEFCHSSFADSFYLVTFFKRYSLFLKNKLDTLSGSLSVIYTSECFTLEKSLILCSYTSHNLSHVFIIVDCSILVLAFHVCHDMTSHTIDESISTVLLILFIGIYIDSTLKCLTRYRLLTTVDKTNEIILALVICFHEDLNVVYTSLEGHSSTILLRVERITLLELLDDSSGILEEVDIVIVKGHLLDRMIILMEAITFSYFEIGDIILLDSLYDVASKCLLVFGMYMVEHPYCSTYMCFIIQRILPLTRNTKLLLIKFVSLVRGELSLYEDIVEESIGRVYKALYVVLLSKDSIDTLLKIVGLKPCSVDKRLRVDYAYR